MKLILMLNYHAGLGAFWTIACFRVQLWYEGGRVVSKVRVKISSERLALQPDCYIEDNNSLNRFVYKQQTRLVEPSRLIPITKEQHPGGGRVLESRMFINKTKKKVPEKPAATHFGQKCPYTPLPNWLELFQRPLYCLFNKIAFQLEFQKPKERN